MKKHLFIFTLLLIVFTSSCTLASSVLGSINIEDLDFSSIDKNKIDELKSTINNLNLNISNSTEPAEEKNNVNLNQVIEAYDELSKIISNEEIAEFIDDNKQTLAENGVNESILDASTTVLKTSSADTIIDVMKNDLNIEEVQTADTPRAIIESVMENTTSTTRLEIILKLLFSNIYVRIGFLLLLVYIAYSLFITSYIFKKAGKPRFATIIPIYRDVIHLKLCNFSPWVLLLIFIPIIGWLALMAIAVIR